MLVLLLCTLSSRCWLEPRWLDIIRSWFSFTVILLPVLAKSSHHTQTFCDLFSVTFSGQKTMVLTLMIIKNTSRFHLNGRDRWWTLSCFSSYYFPNWENSAGIPEGQAAPGLGPGVEWAVSCMSLLLLCKLALMRVKGLDIVLFS